MWFWNFEKFYIRVYIFERLFLKILENTKDGAFKINSDMINLIGCNKENFFKLLHLMEYKTKNKNDKKMEETFVYKPKIARNKKAKEDNKTEKNNPFEKLSELRFR